VKNACLVRFCHTPKRAYSLFSLDKSVKSVYIQAQAIGYGRSAARRHADSDVSGCLNETAHEGCVHARGCSSSTSSTTMLCGPQGVEQVPAGVRVGRTREGQRIGCFAAVSSWGSRGGAFRPERRSGPYRHAPPDHLLGGWHPFCVPNGARGWIPQVHREGR
jgi:hypothetical protein